MPVETTPRDAYGATLMELGEANPDIVVLDADLSSSTQTKQFAKAYPKRFFNVGLAEQNMVGIAAGLAASGKVPFISTFAVFATCRCFDQLRTTVSQPGLNVKVVATHGGITVGEDGASHHAVEDLSLVCSLPSFTVIVPADGTETSQAVQAAAAARGPFYIRLTRGKAPAVCGDSHRFQLGRAAVMRQGVDATIIAMGIMVAKALEAAEALQAEGVSCRVLNMSTLKPLDEPAVLAAARETGAIVTAEEHLEHGGLGSMVSQVVSRESPALVRSIALKSYTKSGKAEDLLQKQGLTATAIADAVRSALKTRRTR